MGVVFTWEESCMAKKEKVVWKQNDQVCLLLTAIVEAGKERINIMREVCQAIDRLMNAPPKRPKALVREINIIRQTVVQYDLEYEEILWVGFQTNEELAQAGWLGPLVEQSEVEALFAEFENVVPLPQGRRGNIMGSPDGEEHPIHEAV